MNCNCIVFSVKQQNYLHPTTKIQGRKKIKRKVSQNLVSNLFLYV